MKASYGWAWMTVPTRRGDRYIIISRIFYQKRGAVAAYITEYGAKPKPGDIVRVRVELSESATEGGDPWVETCACFRTACP